MASAISINPVILAFGFSVVTGLFFEGYPAYQASKLDLIEAPELALLKNQLKGLYEILNRFLAIDRIEVDDADLSLETA